MPRAVFGQDWQSPTRRGRAQTALASTAGVTTSDCMLRRSLRQNAVNTALGLLDKAEFEFTAQTFTFLNEAMQELTPYLDVPIEEEYPFGFYV